MSSVFGSRRCSVRPAYIAELRLLMLYCIRDMFFEKSGMEGERMLDMSERIARDGWEEKRGPLNLPGRRLELELEPGGGPGRLF